MGLESISDTLFKSRGFKVTVIVFTSNGNALGDKTKLINVRDNPYKKDCYSINLDTYYNKIIGFHKSSFDEQTKSYSKESIYFSTKQFSDLDRILKMTTDWLTTKYFDYLFKKDSDGKVLGIGGAPPIHPAIYKNPINYVKFSPTTVIDRGVKHEGVSIYTNKTPIVSLPHMEYLSFSFAVRNFLRNSHSTTLQLMNTGITIASSRHLK